MANLEERTESNAQKYIKYSKYSTHVTLFNKRIKLLIGSCFLNFIFTENANLLYKDPRHVIKTL